MLLMALDHASYFIARVHPSEFWSVPLPEYAGALGFLTRFVSHLCAPGFFFLTGLGMTLFADSRRRAGWSPGAVRKHYLLRGVLLIVLQVAVENRVWEIGSSRSGAGSGQTVVFLGVLYGLGASMIAGVCLIGLPSGVLAVLGACALIGTQAVVPGLIAPGETFPAAVRLLMVPGRTPPVFVLYPCIPWLGFTLLGMAYSRWAAPRADAAGLTAALGAACLVLFAVLRIGGGFGNTHPVDLSSWVGFLSVTKYPPSLTFALITLGLDLLLLAGFARASGRPHGLLQPLTVFGRTPLFFYVAHLYLYALASKLVPGDGTGLAAMYPAWVAGLIVLYPCCRRYDRFKRAVAPASFWRLL
jgi:uncharacterized membrane protein